MTALRRAAAAGAFALLAAPGSGCQPLPHPFADDRPPAALLAIRDTAGVSIAPIVGKPPALAARLGEATARAFLKRDIPASDRTASLGSYQLYGRVVEAPVKEGAATITALWRLYDAKGRAVGERTVELAGAERDWVSGAAAPIERLAEMSAEGLAPLLEDKMPVAAAPPSDKHRVSLEVDKISGAPGDGGTALATAIETVLKRHELAVTDGDAKADLRVAAEVTVSPVKPDKQHIKIVWHVRRADGSEIGTVGQENDVPKGMLDGPWGDVAYSIAIAAGDGLAQLAARGAPPSKP